MKKRRKMVMMQFASQLPPKHARSQMPGERQHGTVFGGKEDALWVVLTLSIGRVRSLPDAAAVLLS